MLHEIVLQADVRDAGLRLDTFVAARLPEHTRAQVHKFIKGAAVTINNRPTKPSLKIMGNEHVVVKVPAKKSLGLVAQHLPLEILFSDEHLAVINKPVGLVVHPGAGVMDNTLVNALLHYFPHMAVGGAERPGIVHRLDKNTSGVMVVAITHEAHVALAQAFKNRQVEKIYRAFCFGELEQDHIELKTGHARHPHNRLRFFTGLPAPLTLSNKVRLAHTSIEVNHRAYGISDLKATLHTGRTHQIRAHLADINHPLVGDRLYGGHRDLPKAAPASLHELLAGLVGQALHAETITFSHPISKEPLKFSAPLPCHLAAIQAILDGTHNE